MLAAYEAAYKAELWERRNFWLILEWYLDRDQLEDARRFFEGCAPDKPDLPKQGWCDDISRQRGKSYKWTAILVAWCHCYPGQYTKYAAQLGNSVREIIAPAINALTKDMPEAMRPSEDKIGHIWRFPKGPGEEPSEIKAAGVNLGHYDDLRGPKAHIIVQDEAAFYDDFDRVQEVLGPQLSTTLGPMVYCTTPPYVPTHPYEAVLAIHRAIGRYVHRTIHNHPRMSPEEIRAHLESVARTKGLSYEAFLLTTYYQREYLCMHVVEISKVVIPEWSSAAPAPHPEGTSWGDVLTAECPRPAFFDAYDSLDIGFTRDPSAWIGGFWDWGYAILVIEDETPPLRQKEGAGLAAAIVEKRRALWPTKDPITGAPRRPPSKDARKSPCGTYWLPRRSIGDGSGNGADKLEEIRKAGLKEGVAFEHASKGDLEARVSAVRTMVAQGKIWIHPRCVNLRTQIATGLWADKNKSEFERTETHHLDHLAALVDLVDSLERGRCPYPDGWDLSEAARQNTAFPDRPKPVTVGTQTYDPASEDLSSAFGQLPWE